MSGALSLLVGARSLSPILFRFVLVVSFGLLASFPTVPVMVCDLVGGVPVGAFQQFWFPVQSAILRCTTSHAMTSTPSDWQDGQSAQMYQAPGY